MSTQDTASEHVAGSEGMPGGVEADRPLSLGDALTFTPDPLRGHVVVESARPVVFVGPLGMAALRDWLACSQENSEDELELWTASGIAEETGTARGTVYKWIERDDFPRRFAHPVGGGPVWEADRVRAWLLTSRPPMGRPKAS
jgi:predicted DNA-binding transcriptional regulator AlpA